MSLQKIYNVTTVVYVVFLFWHDFLLFAFVGQPFDIASKQIIAVPDNFGNVLKDLTARVLDMDINTLVYSQLSCPVLQTLLLVHQQKNPKLCEKLCKKIIKLIDSSQTKENTCSNDDNNGKQR